MQRLIVCAVFLALSVGVAEAQRPVATLPKTTTRKTAQPKLSDSEIEAAIKARFAQSKISANRFQVHVQGGVATLEGRTDIVQHKGTATRLAKSAGAVAVNNRIQVSDAARKKLSETLESGRRRAQIKRGEPRK